MQHRKSSLLSAFARRARWVALGASIAGCHGESSAPKKDCTTLLWAKPKRAGAAVSVRGSWALWSPKGQPMVESGDDDWKVVALNLPPGEYGYRFVEDGAERLDPFAPLSTYQGITEASLVVVGDCQVPSLAVDRVDASSGTIAVDATFTAAANGSPLDVASVQAALPAGDSFEVGASDPSTGKVSLVIHHQGDLKAPLSLAASSADGVLAPKVNVAAWTASRGATFEDGVLYQIMIDRYRGDGGKALAPPKTPGARAGGTLDGVRAEIEKGTFEALGVTALWLSPVYLNPTEARIGRDGRSTESYHGYWPADSRKVDPRFGGDAALHAVVASAHAHGLRVLLDIVPNHVYESNPRFSLHGKDGWFHSGQDACVCGAPGCDWGAYMLTCQFASYLPDYRFEDDAVMKLAAEDAIYWRDTFDLDGFRIDAVPMMPRSATRRTVRALRDSLAPREASFTIGEVFTGQGTSGIDSIKYYLGPDGLDAAFDFPLMWAMRDAIATDRAGLETVEATMADVERALRGSGSLLGTMMDNHDTSRFISEARGDGDGDPWTSAPVQPSSADAYDRHRLALTLMFSAPGLPVVYYGDELALAGANDPDSRRVMPEEATLLSPQKQSLALARRLGKLRACSAALRRGARIPLSSGPTSLAFERDAQDGFPVFAVFSKASSKTTLALSAPPGDYVDLITGEAVNPVAVALEPRSARLVSLRSNPCNAPSSETP